MGYDHEPFTLKHIRDVPEFYLATTEVTANEFERRIGNLPHSMKPEKSVRNQPVNSVSFGGALQFGGGAARRLPTEAEYEFAATMGGTRKFPWGDSPDLITDWEI